ncbi:hypothetical protein CGRA01v4_13446 [Colletotrichum graminicola]|nr:hypothetical protein CGRA01v4_13446 [Colletotrichum graminicola]
MCRAVRIAPPKVHCIGQSFGFCWYCCCCCCCCQWLAKVVSVSRLPYFGLRNRNPCRDGAGKNTREG